MIIFGTLVAFVTIFISENVETRLSFYSTYEIGVKGTFICNQEKIGFAYILVGEKEVDPRVDRPIAGTAGKYLKPFYLIGSVKSFYKP
uniref:COesterase domain-containing protein n=1 Tax=Strongyloides venezuelensis TaxID=75913 RepID=A0A0K0FX87_STRVS